MEKLPGVVQSNLFADTGNARFFFLDSGERIWICLNLKTSVQQTSFKSFLH